MACCWSAPTARTTWDAAPVLAASLSRWRERTAVEHLRLANLPGPSLHELVGEILHADPKAVARLVTLIEPQTHGNQYETVELLNALRRDGVLTATAGGWRWDEASGVCFGWPPRCPRARSIGFLRLRSRMASWCR